MVSVLPASIAQLVVDAPTKVSANTAFNFTVTALDQFGNIATGFAGTVDFASSDAQALLPVNTTLASGVGIFSATLITGGKTTLIASDSGNASLADSAMVSVFRSSGIAPFVQSINRTNPVGPATSGSIVTFTVTFSQAVTGVNLSAFALELTGTATGTLSQVTPVSGAVYKVTVTGITGVGRLGLNLVNNDTIYNLTANPLINPNAPAAFQTQQTFATGVDPDSLAIGDVNGDANPDLIVANPNSNTVSVLLGNGDGTFQVQQTLATGNVPMQVVVGDVNGDGKPDLVVANAYSNTVSVLLGNGNATFQAQQTFAAGTRPRSVAIADVTGDGKSDLVVANLDGNSVSVLLGNGNGDLPGPTNLFRG